MIKTFINSLEYSMYDRIKSISYADDSNAIEVTFWNDDNPDDLVQFVLTLCSNGKFDIEVKHFLYQDAESYNYITGTDIEFLTRLYLAVRNWGIESAREVNKETLERRENEN